MTRLGHRRTIREISAYVDGELDPRASARVAAHLRDCWGCSGDAELVRLVKRSLRKLRDRDHDSVTARRLERFAASLRD